MGELTSDVSAARDHDVLGQFGQLEHSVRGDRMFDAGQLVRRWTPGRAANRDQNFIGCDRLAAFDKFQRVRVDKFCPLFKHIHTRIYLPTHVQSGKAIDFGMEQDYEPEGEGLPEPKPGFTDVREIERRLTDVGIELMKGTETESGPDHIILTDPDGNVLMFDQFY